MKFIKELKGTNGTIALFEDRIIISRKTLGGIAAFGFVGDRSIFYTAIQGVEYSGGLLKIIPKGCNSNSYNNIKYSDIRKAQKDDNVILLSPSKRKDAENICEIINRKVNEQYMNDKNMQVNNFSSVDEILKFKKLLDEGIITQEEFEKKKKELL